MNITRPPEPENLARRLHGLRIAVLGYGAQGHAHAQNLRDAGCDVVVGLRRGSPRWEPACLDGLHVEETAAAVSGSRVVMMLLPDEVQPEVYARDVAPRIEAGAYLGFAHGLAIAFGKLAPAPQVNTFLVAPKGPGTLVRRRFVEGGGVPCLVGVGQDPAGDTRDVAIAYACAIGGGRAGLLETTFRDEAETDLFGEQAVLCGGLSELIRAGFETLVEAGYEPELAYLECLHECKQVADLIQRHGIAGMRRHISRTACYGDLSRGRRVIGPAVRAAMREILAEVRSGAFADEWLAEHARGCDHLRAATQRDADHPIEQVGARLRAELPMMLPPM